MYDALTITKDIVLIAGGIAGLLTVMKGVAEYRRQGKQKRVELYLELENRLLRNPDFQKIRNMINDKDPAVGKLDHKLRSDYAGFFETIALMTNSGLMTKEVSCHMFSWDAIACWENKKFWEDFDTDDQYWGVLRVFVNDMKRLRPILKGNPKKCKL